MIATAVSAPADFLITGDHRLRRVDSYQGVAIRTPREFLELLEAESEINP